MTITLIEYANYMALRSVYARCHPFAWFYAPQLVVDADMVSAN